jgi:hypothetical protein
MERGFLQTSNFTERNTEGGMASVVNTALAVNIRLTFARCRLNLAAVGFSTPLREERMRQARAGG